MTMADAIIQARRDLGVSASEDTIVALAAARYCAAASPAERDRLFQEEACREVFEVLLERAPELTEAQIQALELTEAQAAQMAARRRGH